MPGLLDLERQLRHRAERVAVVELLECLSPAMLKWHLADEEDQRGRVLKRGVDAGSGMRCSRRARHEADAGPSGHLSVGLGHVRGAGLVPCDDEADGRISKCVEDGDVALTRNAECGVDAVNDELVNEDAGAAATHSSIGSSKKMVAR